MKTNGLILAGALVVAIATTACQRDSDNSTSSAAAPPASASAAAPESSAPTSDTAMASPASPSSNTLVGPRVAKDPGLAPGNANLSFDQLDTDHDGFLSPTEVQRDEDLKRHFDEIDTNHVGKLSREEVEAWRSAHPVSPTTAASPGG